MTKTRILGVSDKFYKLDSLSKVTSLIFLYMKYEESSIVDKALFFCGELPKGSVVRVQLEALMEFQLYAYPAANGVT